MPPSFVTIDTTADLDRAPTTSERTLLLAPPSIATQEGKLRDLFQSYDRTTTDLQMLDRLSAGFVSLPPDSYDLVLVLTDVDGSRRSEALSLLNRAVYTSLVPSMKPGAKLQTEDGSFGKSEALEAVLAGLVETSGGFEKPDIAKTAAIPLRFGAKKKAATQNGVVTNGHDREEAANGDDELIDEDTLLSDEDLSRPVQRESYLEPAHASFVPILGCLADNMFPEAPPECQPKAGRRRRACKDCTCGLASRLEAEDAERRANADKALNTVKLDLDDLNELDFTVQGKTGSCGNCSLGDAFRCAGCPYIGLPAFKPGQEVQLLNDMAQL
jgi:hypothetical protein